MFQVTLIQTSILFTVLAPGDLFFIIKDFNFSYGWQLQTLWTIGNPSRQCIILVSCRNILPVLSSPHSHLYLKYQSPWYLYDLYRNGHFHISPINNTILSLKSSFLKLKLISSYIKFVIQNNLCTCICTRLSLITSISLRFQTTLNYIYYTALNTSPEVA